MVGLVTFAVTLCCPGSSIERSAQKFSKSLRLFVPPINKKMIFFNCTFLHCW